MNAEIRRTQNMLVAVDEFLDEHAITPPIAKATAEITILKGSITELATLAANQDAGRAEWRGASDDRVRLKLALRDKLSEISAIAKVLDPVLYPTASGVKAVRILDSIMGNRGHLILDEECKGRFQQSDICLRARIDELAFERRISFPAEVLGVIQGDFARPADRPLAGRACG